MNKRQREAKLELAKRALPDVALDRGAKMAISHKQQTTTERRRGSREKNAERVKGDRRGQ